MSVNFKNRIVYCKLGWDAEHGKKKVFFGGKWGNMEKREANALAYKTGNGLVVVDVDTQDLDAIDKRVGGLLKKLTPTVTTKRGYHYYFEHKNSADFINDSAYTELVDVRSDGGVIFAQYLGKSDFISYKRTGKVYDKIPKKLLSILLELRELRVRTKKKRDRWSEAPKGDIHSATLSYAGKDFHSGLSFDEVMLRGIEYVENYLGGTAREMKLMSKRIKDAYTYYVENKLNEVNDFKSGEVDVAEAIDAVGDNKEILGMLVSAQKKGILELEKTMKTIKQKSGLGMGVLRDMLKEAVREISLNSYFKGELVWDDDMGVFGDVREYGVKLYRKANFIQTAMSKSGYMSATDVAEKLPKVPNRRIIYSPDLDERYIADEFGDDAINSYRGVSFKPYKKIPKLIDKLLNNLFLNDKEAKDYFVQWMAYIVQYKKKTKVSWAFFGASGTGKGLIVDIFMNILGRQNCSINVGDVSLQSAFNAYAYNKLFIHMNEIASDYHGRHGVDGKLKALITDDYLQINMKGIGEINCKNYSNIIINSNKPNPMQVDTTDRRFNTIITDKPLKDLDWFTVGITGDKMIAQYKKFGGYLANIKVDKRKATTIMPESEAKKSVVMQTVNPLALAGSYIKSGDYNELLEFLQIDKKDFEFNLSEIKASCKSKKWSITLLKNIYIAVTGNEVKSNITLSKYFIKPYITLHKSGHSNTFRYYDLSK